MEAPRARAWPQGPRFPAPPLPHTQLPLRPGEGQGPLTLLPQSGRRLGRSLQQLLTTPGVAVQVSHGLAPHSIRGCPQKGPGEERGTGPGRVHLRCWHPPGRSVPPRNSSQGPAASQLRTEGREGRAPAEAASPCTSHGSSLVAMVTSAQANSISRGHAHAQQTGIRGHSSQLSGGGAGGRGLKPPLPPGVSHHSLTGEQCDGRTSLHVPVMRRPAEQSCPPAFGGGGGGPLLGRRKQMGAQGNFIP